MKQTEKRTKEEKTVFFCVELINFMWNCVMLVPLKISKKKTNNYGEI